jgi:hypothetical protein
MWSGSSRLRKESHAGQGHHRDFVGKRDFDFHTRTVARVGPAAIGRVAHKNTPGAAVTHCATGVINSAIVPLEWDNATLT